VTSTPTGLDLDALVAIDVHVHVHADQHGHLALDDELNAAAAKYFKGDPYDPTVPDIAADYRDKKMAAVIFTVDARLAAKGNAKGGVEALRPSLRIGAARRWREFERHFWNQVEALTWASTRLSGHQSSEHHSEEKPPPKDASRSPNVAESLHSFERNGRAALFVFIRSDHDGQVLDAAAYDPEDYL